MKSKLFAIILSVVLAYSVSYAQWTLQGSLPAGQIPMVISVVNQDLVFIAGGPGNSPRLFRSIDAGVTWTNISTGILPPELFAMWARDINTIYVGDGGAPGGQGGNAKVQRTINGGTTWTTILTTGGNAGFINGIVFSRTNPLDGIIQSDPATGGGVHIIYRTIDGGTTWTTQNPPATGGYAAMHSPICVDNQFYGFGTGQPGSASRVVFTSNGGTSWNTVPLNIAGDFVSGFAFSSGKIFGIAATNTSLPSISRSVNGGTTWALLNTGSPAVTGYCTMKFVPGTSVCYLTGQLGASGTVKRSLDNGATWTVMTTGGVTGLFHMELAYISSMVYAYAMNDAGAVIRLIDNLTGVEENGQNLPNEYKLAQNYPNPFNPTTTINYSLPIASHVTVKIYDVLGNEVKTLVDESKLIGNHSVSFDASGLASGVYFYTIKAGDFYDSKKMSLVK